MTNAAGTLAGDAVELGTVGRAQTDDPAPSQESNGFFHRLWQAFRSPGMRAVREVFDASGTFVPLALGKSEFVTGGRFSWAAQASMGVHAVTNTFDLVTDWQRDPRHDRFSHGLVLAGGYLAATGSVIGLCGGLLPGSIICATGALVRAAGFVGYMIDERRHPATPATHASGQVAPQAATAPPPQTAVPAAA